MSLGSSSESQDSNSELGRKVWRLSWDQDGRTKDFESIVGMYSIIFIF